MTAKMPPLVPNLTQFALRFAVVSDTPKKSQPIKLMPFQSALRFAVVSDLFVVAVPSLVAALFQSALRFAVVSDLQGGIVITVVMVSIRFEVRGGFRLVGIWIDQPGGRVSIRFEVRGGFRPPQRCSGPTSTSCFNPL